MNRFDLFVEKIANIDLHILSEKENLVNSLRQLLQVEFHNHLELLEIVAPQEGYEEARKEYYTRNDFIEKLIRLIQNLPITALPEIQAEIPLTPPQSE